MATNRGCTVPRRLHAVERDVLATVRVLAGRRTTLAAVAAQSGCSRRQAHRAVHSLAALGLIGREVILERDRIRGQRLWITECAEQIGAAA
jgi:hypothetical protein